jgi:trigger factor
VTDEAVEKALADIQEAHVLLEPADRPCQEGDVVIADFKGTQNGEEMINREGAELLLDPEKLYPDIPFVENILGMSAGDEKEFEVEIPVTEEEPESDETDKADDEVEEEVAETKEPEKVTYFVKVHEVKSRFVPPIDDDLAIEENYETLLDMRVKVREKLTEQAQKKADGEYVDKVFDTIREGSTVVFPPAALEMQIDQNIQDLEQRFKQQGWSLEDYLKAQGKSPEVLRDELKPQAEEQLIRGQITRALVEAEKISVANKDIDKLLEDRLNETGDYTEELRQQLRDFYTAPESRRWLANDAMMTKFSDRIKVIGEGQAPDLSELSDEEE